MLAVKVVTCVLFMFVLFFFKQKTAYEMRISDWSSGVCSSDLEGSGKGKVVVDGSSGKPAITADFDLANFQAGPFLDDLADFDRILGTTESKLAVQTDRKSVG